MEAVVYERVSPTRNLVANIYFHHLSGIQPVPGHWHPEMELFYYRSTSVKLVYGGKEERVPAGVPVVVGGDVIHSLRPLHTDAPEGLSVIFPSSLVAQIGQGKHLGWHSGPVAKDVQGLLVPMLDKIIALADRWRSPGGGLPINAALYQLLGCLYENCCTGPLSGAEGGPGTALCRNAMHFMQAHFREPITLEKTAQETGVTAPHLSRQMKRVLGMGFRDYLESLRTDFALREVTDEEKPLLEIALHAGFADYRAFCRAVQRRHGTTPLQYKKGRRKSGEKFSSAEWVQHTED